MWPEGERETTRLTLSREEAYRCMARPREHWGHTWASQFDFRAACHRREKHRESDSRAPAPGPAAKGLAGSPALASRLLHRADRGAEAGCRGGAALAAGPPPQVGTCPGRVRRSHGLTCLQQAPPCRQGVPSRPRGPERPPCQSRGQSGIIPQATHRWGPESAFPGCLPRAKNMSGSFLG